jgi:hypothetical protein
MSVDREDKDPNVGGSPSSVMDKSQRWLKDLRARTSRFHEENCVVDWNWRPTRDLRGRHK